MRAEIGDKYTLVILGNELINSNMFTGVTTAKLQLVEKAIKYIKPTQTDVCGLAVALVTTQKSTVDTSTLVETVGEQAWKQAEESNLVGVNSASIPMTQCC